MFVYSVLVNIGCFSNCLESIESHASWQLIERDVQRTKSSSRSNRTSEGISSVDTRSLFDFRETVFNLTIEKVTGIERKIVHRPTKSGTGSFSYVYQNCVGEMKIIDET